MDIVGDYYLVRFDEPETTKGGIIIPSRVDRRDRAVVIQAGDGILSDGSKAHMHAKIGDVVLIVDKSKMLEVELAEMKFYIISNENICAVQRSL